MIKKISFSFIPLILLSSFLFADNISLTDAISLAKKQNKLYLNQDNALYSAKWQKKNALSQFLPKVYFSETALRLNKELLLSPAINLGAISIPEIKQAKENYTSEINVNQSLFTGGKLLLNYKISDLMLKQNILQKRVMEQDLELQTAVLYFQILKLHDLIKLTNESILTYQNHYQKALIKQKNGTALLSEVLQWKVKLEESQSSLKSLDNLLALSYDSWSQFLGLINENKPLVPQVIELTEIETQALNFALYNDFQKETYINKLLSDYKRQNNTLKILDLNKNLLDHSLKMTKTDFLPTLALNFNYQFDNDDKLNFNDAKSWKFIALLSVPLFNGGSNYTAFKAKEFEIAKQNNEIDNNSELIQIQTKKILLDKFDLSNKIATDKTNIELADENRRQINQLVSQGLATYNEQLDAEVLYLSIYMNYISDIYDYLTKDYEIKRYCEE